MLSFKDGMKVLPEAIANHLGSKVKLNAEVVSIKKTADGNYGVAYNEGEQSLTLLTDIVLSTIPAYTASELLGHFNDGIKNHLTAVYYPPVLVLYLAYNKDDIGDRKSVV